VTLRLPPRISASLRIGDIPSELITLVLFRRRALGELSGSEQKIGARVRKSRQKEAAGAVDAVLMQIEWSEGEGLQLRGVGTEGRRGCRSVCERESMVEKRVREGAK
jgi:hypothetical protein